ncbi:MAG: DNA ligase, partial [Armatimonadetes bacterium]|nr:DNA ligase [Armatimonadota bacterium]
MNLEPYRQKRDFTKSPEPPGTDAGPRDQDRLRFVVQKHKASHLHYDLRLELDGVLKSWAVPKGPSLNPSDKRLAVMVEDHPLDYHDFEGTIPEGTYGAGTVMVWDRGDYCVPESCERPDMERALRHDLDKGHVRIVLHGEKLKGRFALARTHYEGEENAWLLIKADDEYADTDIADDDRSVATGRTMNQIAKESSASVMREVDLSDAPASPMPHNVTPMLATLTNQPFDDARWLFEVKWDGYRAIAEIEQAEVRLYSRNLQPFNQQFPSIVQSLSSMGIEGVLDGEVVVVDENGVSQFQALQNYIKTRRGTLVYYAFDILYLQGHDLMGLPLRRRKEILRRVLPENAITRYSDHIEREGTRLFRLAVERGLEGVLAKRADSTYQ